MVIDVKMILLSGMPASGKGVFCDVAEDNGYTTVSMGDIVREEARAHGRLNDILCFALDQRQEYGGDIWAVRTIERLESEYMYDNDYFVVDGLRTPLEYDVFKERYDDSILAYIKAPTFMRRDRLQDRNRPQDKKSFDRRDYVEEKLGTKKLKDKADKVLPGSMSLEPFKKQVEYFLERVDGKS